MSTMLLIVGEHKVRPYVAAFGINRNNICVYLQFLYSLTSERTYTMFDQSPPLLELTNATVVKDGVRILDGLTLAIRVGEHTAIVGPNGSGKSSLIKLLTHQHYPLAGDTPPLRVFGQHRWNVFDLRALLGIVSADMHSSFVGGNSAGRINGLDAVVSGFFASQGLFFHQPVTDEQRRRAVEALARMDAVHLATKMLDAMSTGEARRVLIARALVTEPQALVLDEPTTGLDFVARHRFMEIVRRIAQEGTTVIIVTHHVDEIIPEVERVILLQHGRVARDGPKHQILTSAHLSAVFEAPIAIQETDGYYQAQLGR